MSSKSASGTTPHERVTFLRENGYRPVGDTGKGSHQVWIHDDMARLMRKCKIEMPANLRSNSQQPPCTVMLPSNPAAGTWKALAAQVEWCAGMVQAHAAKDSLDAAKRRLKEQFRAAHSAVRNWEKRTHDAALGRNMVKPDDIGPYPREADAVVSAYLAQKQAALSAQNVKAPAARH